MRGTCGQVLTGGDGALVVAKADDGALDGAREGALVGAIQFCALLAPVLRGTQINLLKVPDALGN